MQNGLFVGVKGVLYETSLTKQVCSEKCKIVWRNAPFALMWGPSMCLCTWSLHEVFVDKFIMGVLVGLAPSTDLMIRRHPGA